MAFTEFYCNASTGSNINAGDLTANGVVTSTNGDWDNAASNRFTAASGTPFSGVSVGDFASVYLDGATLAVFVGRVTAVNASGASLDISATAKSGTKPSAGASGRTCTTGGAWKGPNAAVGFPMNFVTNTLTNSAGDMPRVNYKNNATYSITANITGIGADTTHQGYSSTAGDLGRATLDGGTSGASYNLIGTTVGAQAALIDFICQNNGATGSSTGIFWNSSAFTVLRCVFNSFRGAGFQTNNSGGLLKECEFYSCNQSNTASVGAAYILGTGTQLARCMFHDNTGGNVSGLYCSGVISIAETSFDTNGLRGIDLNGSGAFIEGCDFYNNGSDGVRLLVAGAVHIENSNFVKNGGYGFNGITGNRTGLLQNNGFGAGTQANTSGQTNGLGSIVVAGSITYANDVTPWVDPANGDFRISLAAAKGTGRGSFTQTAASYAGTVGYPDVGSAQHLESGGGVSGYVIGG